MKTLTLGIEVTEREALGLIMELTGRGFAVTVQPDGEAAEPEQQSPPPDKPKGEKPKKARSAPNPFTRKAPAKKRPQGGSTAAQLIHGLAKAGPVPRATILDAMTRSGFSPSGFHPQLSVMKKAGLVQYDNGAVKVLHPELTPADVQRRVREAQQAERRA